MKYLAAADSYKGCLSSREVCGALLRGIGGGTAVPLSDGGEGFADSAASACGGFFVPVFTVNSYGAPVKAGYAVCGDTAVVETALADGLAAAGSRRDPLYASSYGTGYTVRAALEAGYRRIIIGFGGSAVNDGGAGALCALGAVFLRSGSEVVPDGRCGETAEEIDTSGLMPELKEASFIFACDVTNPFCGPCGASEVYSPQKGATAADAERLDRSLASLAELYRKYLGTDMSDVPCAGAAGGLAGGLAAVCRPTVRSGFDVIAELCGFDRKIRECDIVITGEGRTDAQTKYGKLPKRVAETAKKYGKTVVCVSGMITPEGRGIGADLYIPLVRDGVTAEYSLTHAAELLEKAGREIRTLYGNNT